MDHKQTISWESNYSVPTGVKAPRLSSLLGNGLLSGLANCSICNAFRLFILCQSEKFMFFNVLSEMRKTLMEMLKGLVSGARLLF